MCIYGHNVNYTPSMPAGLFGQQNRSLFPLSIFVLCFTFIPSPSSDDSSKPTAALDKRTVSGCILLQQSIQTALFALVSSKSRSNGLLRDFYPLPCQTHTHRSSGLQFASDGKENKVQPGPHRSTK